MNNKLRLGKEGMIAVILSFVGGMLNVYCLFNFNVYAMVHTGNIIKIVTNLIDGDYLACVDSLIVVTAFAVGIFLANIFEQRYRGDDARGCIKIAIAILAAAALIPNDAAPGELSGLKLFSASLFGYEGPFWSIPT